MCRPGKHKVEVWHETLGKMTQEVDVRAGAPTRITLAKAFRGETVVALSDLTGGEHRSERQAGYSRLVEVYVPIFREGTSTTAPDGSPK